jgi:DNA-binding transcriptional ArsR family regulator
MANHSLDRVYDALGNATRRAIVHRLGRGPAAVSELAAPFRMALPSFMKHVTVLERSGLVRSRKVGRVRTCELRPATLRKAEAWITGQRRFWEARSDRLAAYAESLHEQEQNDVG